ncbi:MAG: pentapeptide repeat-containing protein [Nostoc sp. EkiNYC01]|nr:pentapeptide repeat-containing protein [Nostoc sp. EkiNYC01]
MANEEHLAILRQGVEVWNEWRENNPEIKPNLFSVNFSKTDLSKADFSFTNISESDFSEVDFTEANFNGANLCNTNLESANLSYSDLNLAQLKKTYFCKANLTRANFTEANLHQANLIESKLIKTNFSRANLSLSYLLMADLSEAILAEANLSKAMLNRANLNEANFTGANLSEADLFRTQALGTIFILANLTGACLEDWNINSFTNLDYIDCKYVYLKSGQQERRPNSGNFAPCEFTKLFQKSLETVDLIFRNGIDWDAFAYSFKKLEVENQGAQLDVQSIEKKGNGILVVRVAVSPDADKAKIHSEFIQSYEFAAKALEAQYQARLEDKDKVINQLFSSINQLNRQLAETSGKVSIYYQTNSQFAGGIVDAINVNTEQVDGNIQNINNQETPG